MKVPPKFKLVLTFGLLLNLWPYLLFPYTHFRILASSVWSFLWVTLVP